jgi:pimeloyl-ACP methyl ester carboxylesterase
VTASGVRVRVAELGSGDPVIVVHGLFVDHHTWDPVAENLPAGFRVIAPDLPGFGTSEKPSPSRFPYGVHAFAETVADLYAGLALGRSALVGHGLGGAVALTLAARHPELVSRLVLIDTLCYERAPTLEAKLALLPFMGGLVWKQLLGKTAFRSLFRERLLGPRAAVSSERLDYFYEAFNEPTARGSTLATLRATVDLRSLEAQIARVQVPTLVVWGRHDCLVPPAYGQRLAREIRGAGFELVDAGHSPHEELPREIADVLARFLRDERRSYF